jgi:phosphotransferase system IIB component
MTKTFSARAIELNRCATRMTVIFLDAKIVEIAALTCCSAVGGMKEER